MYQSVTEIYIFTLGELCFVNEEGVLVSVCSLVLAVCDVPLTLYLLIRL